MGYHEKRAVELVQSIVSKTGNLDQALLRARRAYGPLPAGFGSLIVVTRKPAAVPYVPARQGYTAADRAAAIAAMRRDPSISSRALAERFGASVETVRVWRSELLGLKVCDRVEAAALALMPEPVRQIAKKVRDRTGVPVALFTGQDRRQPVVVARARFVYALRAAPRPDGKERSWPEVTRWLAIKDHTSAIYLAERHAIHAGRKSLTGSTVFARRAGKVLAG